MIGTHVLRFLISLCLDSQTAAVAWSTFAQLWLVYQLWSFLEKADSSTSTPFGHIQVGLWSAWHYYGRELEKLQVVLNAAIGVLEGQFLGACYFWTCQAALGPNRGGVSHFVTWGQTGSAAPLCCGACSAAALTLISGKISLKFWDISQAAWDLVWFGWDILGNQHLKLWHFSLSPHAIEWLPLQEICGHCVLWCCR